MGVSDREVRFWLKTVYPEFLRHFTGLKGRGEGGLRCDRITIAAYNSFPVICYKVCDTVPGLTSQVSLKKVRVSLCTGF